MYQWSWSYQRSLGNSRPGTFPYLEFAELHLPKAILS